jgi:hypothetical protein
MARDEVIGGVLGLGGIEAIRIMALACVEIMVQGEGAQAIE